MPRERNAVFFDLNAVSAAGDDGLPRRLKVLPLGEIKGRDGRWWDLPEEDAMRLVDGIRGDGIDIVVDLNHGSYFGDPRAAGWLRAASFEVDEDGIYAEVEWTELGRSELAARHFRYLSPTIITEKNRILGLESVGLVNIPNLRELTAFNRKNTYQEAHMQDSQLEHLKARIGELQEELARLTREKADVERELNEARAGQDDALKKLADAEAKVAELERRELEMELNAMLDRAVAEGRIVPAQRDTLMAMGKRDINALKEFIERSPARFASLTMEQAPPSGAAAATGDYAALASRGVQVDPNRMALHQRAKELAQAANISYAAAVNALVREV